jgi:hypothetical protein
MALLGPTSLPESTFLPQTSLSRAEFTNCLPNHNQPNPREQRIVKMQLKDTQRIELPPSADMHVHLRQGDMMNLVTPTIRNGGVDTVFVMVRTSRDLRLAEV